MRLRGRIWRERRLGFSSGFRVSRSEFFGAEVGVNNDHCGLRSRSFELGRRSRREKPGARSSELGILRVRLMNGATASFQAAEGVNIRTPEPGNAAAFGGRSDSVDETTEAGRSRKKNLNI